MTASASSSWASLTFKDLKRVESGLVEDEGVHVERVGLRHL
jgi:hypothetical protein